MAARKPAPQQACVKVPVRVAMPLGYLHLQPVSGRSWDEELVEALKAMGVKRDERLVVTFSRGKEDDS